LISLLFFQNANADQPVFGTNVMVVAQEPFAADVGLNILDSGGNAIDAAVAVAFTLAVTHPYAGNIGGGGFMLIHTTNGESSFIDFRETAPAMANTNMFHLDTDGKLIDDTTNKWRSAGVPGTVRGLYMAFTNYKSGKKQWSELIQPAIDFANNGFPISYWQAENFRTSATLKTDSNSANIFLKNSKGTFLNFGEYLRQTNLGVTLARIANNPDDFYTGVTAQRLAEAMSDHYGLISLDDLRAYRPIQRKPLDGYYKGYRILTAPPPSSGGVAILQMLGMLANLDYTNGGAGSAASYHFLAEVMRRAFADGTSICDPDRQFMENEERQIESLLASSYLKRRAASIHPVYATVTSAVKIEAGERTNNHEGTDTTHLNIIDKYGNIVAMTYSLNSGYGSGITVPSVGFLLNDTMKDFLIGPPYSRDQFGKVQGPMNKIEPNKRPLSSMSPTIILKGRQPYLVLGAPGGSRIITSVLQTIVNVIDFRMNVQDAVDFPRIHHAWTSDPIFDKLEYEQGLSPDTLRRLEDMGYRIDLGKPIVLARVEAILIGANGATTNIWLQGAHDPRGTGKAVGH
jgi:gamma-glutamyltranspeptidase / glutathione hydrolase